MRNIQLEFPKSNDTKFGLPPDFYIVSLLCSRGIKGKTRKDDKKWPICEVDTVLMWNVGPPWSSQKFRIRTHNTGKKRKLSGRRPSSGVRRSCSLLNYQGPEDQSLITGMPEEFTKERVVRIFKPAKSAMQSGTAGIKRYIHTFLTYLYIRGL